MAAAMERLGTALRLVVAIGVAAYLASRLLTTEPSPAIDWIGYTIVVMCAAGSAWIAGERPDADRLGSRFLALAIASWGVGVFVQGYDQFVRGVVPYPSLADLWYLLFVPLAFLAVGRLLIRSRSVSVGETLDAIVVGLAVISVGGAIALQPNLEGLDGDRWAAFTQLMYPVSDIVLLAFVLALATSQGFRLSQRAILLVAGLAVFAAGDTVYFMRAMSGTYSSGSLLDASWAVGILLLAEAPWRPARIGRRLDHRRASMLATILAMSVAVAILVNGALQAGTLAWFVVLPATATLVAAVARLAWSVREAERTASESTLARQDSLTDLPNRRAFLEHMADRIDEEAPFEVLLVDLDRFKEINDVLGHHAGDLLLTAVADRFSQARLSGAFLARIGGDEFGVVTLSGDGERQAGLILQSLTAPFPVEGVPLQIGSSIGIARFPEQAETGGDILRHADVAMYRAKRTRAGSAVYDAAADRVDANRLALATELGQAVRSPAIVLWYQPVVDAAGRVVSVEALMRWDHPRLGLLQPWTFLPIVQQVGAMAALTENVVAQAIRDAAILRRSGHRWRVWINLDASDIGSCGLPDLMSRRCGIEGVAPADLGVEITEEALLSEPDAARGGIERLRELGLSVAIDDFGTGYSSLAYLQHLPVTHLKVDRTFVAGLLAADPVLAGRARAVTRSIIALGHELGISVVAEGVEEPSQQQELIAMACDAMQGFLHGRPMPMAELLARHPAGRTDPVRDPSRR